jgi:protein-S-isoprenylcysteine O-methyltransferase Ste14
MWARLFQWLGALLFLCSLGYFLLSYITTFGAPATGGAATLAVTWNVTLFTLFALHHSVCARTPVRLWITRLVPTALERSTYVWIASLLLIAVCALWRPVPGVAWDTNEAVRWPLRLVQLSGVWFVIRSAAMLDVLQFAGIADSDSLGLPPVRDDSAQVPAAAEVPTVEFKTTGPYGWVRHPIYTGWFLIVFAMVPMTMTRLTFAVVSCAYVLIAIPLEEGSMRAGARQAYGRYAAQVRWRLLPGVY